MVQSCGTTTRLRHHWRIQDFRLGVGRGAEGMGFTKGVSPSPMRLGSGEGAVTLPRKVLDFLDSEWCILRAF